MCETPVPSPAAAPDASSEDRQQPKETQRKWWIGGRLAWLAGWGAKGGLALTDQALFAGAQFVLNILLARWLLPAEYGAFAVAYSVFVLAAGAHSALLLEPMTIFGSGRYFKSRRGYLKAVLRGHWLVTVPVGLLLLGTGLLLGRLDSPAVGHALSALGLALPVMLFAWFTRRAFYVELQPGRAAAGSAIYFCGLIALIVGLHSEGMLLPTTAILAMGIAAFLRGGFELIWLRFQWPASTKRFTAGSLVAEHWGYGRWALAAALAIWVPLNVYYLVLPVWFGLKAAGVLKALMNLANPANHSLMAFGLLALPMLVQLRDRGGIGLVKRTVRRIAVLFLMGSVAYLFVLWFFRVQLIGLLYGGKYLEYSGLPVLLVGLAPFVMAGVVALGSALRACERPDRIFWSYLTGSIAAVTVGIWLAARLGLVGALVGYLVSSAALVSVLWYFYRRLSWTATT